MYHVTIVDLGRSLHGVLGDAMPRFVDAEAEGAVFWDEFGRAWARDAYGRQVPSLHIEDFGIIGPCGIAAPLNSLNRWIHSYIVYMLTIHRVLLYTCIHTII